MCGVATLATSVCLQVFEDEGSRSVAALKPSAMNPLLFERVRCALTKVTRKQIGRDWECMFRVAGAHQSSPRQRIQTTCAHQPPGEALASAVACLCSRLHQVR